MPLRSYRDLQVWQEAMDLADVSYDVTDSFPAAERFGQIAQIRDAATSIPSNIAEGYGRRHRGDYVRHLSIANGSLAELETRLLLSFRRRFISQDRLDEIWVLAQRVGKMLRSLIDALEREIERSPTTNRILRTGVRKQTPDPSPQTPKRA
ncbi:MAG: four helix bundle protein [Phycisphaerae bacterium]